MGVKAAQDRKGNQGCKGSFGELRTKLMVGNGFLMGLGVVSIGNWVDCGLVLIYLAGNLTCLLLPRLKQLVAGRFRYLLGLIDFCFTFYIMVRTGGPESDFFPVLFFPVVAAAISCGYKGTLIWCTLMAATYLGSALVLGYFRSTGIMIRVGYLYLVGIFANSLINLIYRAKEVVPEEHLAESCDYKRLNQFLKEVAASSDVNSIFAETLRIIKENTSATMAAVMIVNLQGELKIFDSYGWNEPWLASYHNYPLSKYSLTLAPILVFKKPLICADISKHSELIQAFSGIPVKSLAAYPLIARDELVGVVMITSQQVQSISGADSQIFESISYQAGIAIQNAMDLNEEKHRADTDGLTGLYNRRYFNETLEYLVGEFCRNSGYLSLVLMDVDNFKSYNDTFGHPAGDKLLKKLARVIAGTVRGEDIVARYGGEEIVVILRGSHNRLALEIAEDIRQAVEAITGLERPVTVSLGVATLPTHATNAQGLLEYADKSLYAAKRMGKNRVCCGWELS